MKKYILIIAVTMMSIQSFGQINKIVGKWAITVYTTVDTITAGIDEINEHVDEYKSGKKKLDPQFIVFNSTDYEANNAMEVTITKEKANFRVKNSKNTINQLISYDPKIKFYFTLINESNENRKLIAKYDSKTDKLLFFSDDYLFYELTRKK